MAFTLGFHIILASFGVAFTALMMVANYRGLRRDDTARCCSPSAGRVVAVTFAVGAVTGTVLSFEFGLLWPAFMGRYGGYSACCSRGGDLLLPRGDLPRDLHLRVGRLSPWAHFWAGVPVAMAGLGGAFSVVAANAWMNQPAGFSRGGGGASVEPFKALFNGAVPYEVPHVPGRVLVTGFVVAASMRSGCCGAGATAPPARPLIPLGCGVATPLQFLVGDSRADRGDQPSKFAAIEACRTPRPT